MAGSSIQGFVKSGNLRENEQDRQALNNLGEAPIADDIALFINNSLNKSELIIRVEEYDKVTGIITIDNRNAQEQAERSAIFTNGDPVSIQNLQGGTIRADLFVARSDGDLSFGFASDQALEDDFFFFPETDFKVVRPDAVTLNNIVSLGLTSESSDATAGIDDESGGQVTQSLETIENYNDAFNDIYSYLDVSKYLAKRKFVEDEDVATDDDFRMEGTFTIRDPSDTIISEGVSATSPGLYITNPSSPVNNIQRIRAFSDTKNPWEDTGTALATDAVSAQTGDLKLNQGLKVSGITKTNSTGNVDSNTFTHKLKVRIDGIDYFLCLTT